MKRIQATVDKQTWDRLDTLAGKLGKTRGQLIRDAVFCFLNTPLITVNETFLDIRHSKR